MIRKVKKLYPKHLILYDKNGKIVDAKGNEVKKLRKINKPYVIIYKDLYMVHNQKN